MTTSLLQKHGHCHPIRFQQEFHILYRASVTKHDVYVLNAYVINFVLIHFQQEPAKKFARGCGIASSKNFLVMVLQKKMNSHFMQITSSSHAALTNQTKEILPLSVSDCVHSHCTSYSSFWITWTKKGLSATTLFFLNCVL